MAKFENKEDLEQIKVALTQGAAEVTEALKTVKNAIEKMQEAQQKLDIVLNSTTQHNLQIKQAAKQEATPSTPAPRKGPQ